MTEHDRRWVDEHINKIREENEARTMSWPQFLAMVDEAEFFSKTAFPEEECAFAEFIEQRAPRRILEMGTGNGHFSNIIIRAMAPDARMVTFDIGPGATFERLARLARGEQIISGFVADTMDPATVERVKGILGPDPVDFMFLDTDHSQESTRKEVDIWLPYVKDGGVMAFHDIYTSPQGVQRVWRDLQKSFHNHHEFVTNGPATYGIGALVKE